MKRLSTLASTLCLTACMLSCGPEPSGEVGLSIDSSRLAAIDPNVRSMVVYLFAGDQSCDVIEFSGPSVAGVYQDSFTVGGSQAPQASFGALVPDTYTVVAWAFDENLAAIGYGCADTPVIIEAGLESQVAIELDAYP